MLVGVLVESRRVDVLLWRSWGAVGLSDSEVQRQQHCDDDMRDLRAVCLVRAIASDFDDVLDV